MKIAEKVKDNYYVVVSIGVLNAYGSNLGK